MATLTIVNDLLDKRFLDDGGSDSAHYRLGFICALEKNAGLAVGPCPFGLNSSEADGYNFAAIEEQENQEKSNELNYYKGIDNNPALGLNYYRIKQIYADGSFDYSNVKGINFNLDLNALTVFPNPAQEEVFVNLKNYAGQTGNIQVTNAFGSQSNLYRRHSRVRKNEFGSTFC